MGLITVYPQKKSGGCLRGKYSTPTPWQRLRAAANVYPPSPSFRMPQFSVKRSGRPVFILAAVCLLGTAGCYVMRPSSGAGQTTRAATQDLSGEAVAAPKGYRVELMASGLTF